MGDKRRNERKPIDIIPMYLFMAIKIILVVPEGNLLH